jgi:hypothetical protein
VHALFTTSQRRRDLRRHAVRVQLRRRISPVRQHLRRQLGGGQLWHHILLCLRRPGQRGSDLRRVAVWFPVLRWFPRLQQQLPGQQQRSELRPVLHGLPRAGQRHRDLRRNQLRHRLRQWLPQLRRPVRFQQQRSELRPVLRHGLRRACQRHRDL